MYHCPSYDGSEVNLYYAGYNNSNYAGVHGGGIVSVSDSADQPGNGLFGELSFVTLDGVTDGTSFTFAVGERVMTDQDNHGAIWMRSVNRLGNAGDGTSVAGVCDRRAMLNDMTNPEAFNSNHMHGAQFVMVDGSVLFVSEKIECATYERLGQRDDGKKLGAY